MRKRSTARGMSDGHDERGQRVDTDRADEAMERSMENLRKGCFVEAEKVGHGND
jgi:hypothetical protein